MYGVEWLIGMALLGLAAGLGGGYLLARQLGSGGQRLRELEEQLAAARRQYEDYRHEVVTQFSETARKFQTLNDSYTDLHRQLAKSSSILCGDVSGPLLAAPSGHQDLLTERTRETAEAAEAAEAATAQPDPIPEPESPPSAQPPAPTTADANGAPDATPDEEPPTLRERVERAAQSPPAAVPAFSDIRVAEPADGRGALLREPRAESNAAAGPPESPGTGTPGARSATGPS